MQQKFSNTLARLINDIKGVINISDDIIVYDKDQQSYDLSLHKVLQRLNDNGPEINLLKCKFSVSQKKNSNVSFLNMICRS